MEEILNLKEKIEKFRQLEGESFVCDGSKVEEVYAQAKERKMNLLIKTFSFLGAVVSTICFLLFTFLVENNPSFMFAVLGVIFIVPAIWVAFNVKTMISDSVSVFCFLTGIALVYRGVVDSDGEVMIITTSLILIALSVWIGYKYKKYIFDLFSSFGYVIGLVFLGIGVMMLENSNGFHSDDFTYSLLVVIYLVLALIVIFVSNNRLLSFLSVVLIGGSLLFFAMQSRPFGFQLDMEGCFCSSYNVILMTLFVLMSFFESKIMKHRRLYYYLYDAARIVTLVISVILSIWLMVEKKYGNEACYYLQVVAVVSLSLWTISRFLKVMQIETKKRIWILAVSAVLLIPFSYMIPIAFIALLYVVCSFYSSYKTGFVLSVVSFIYSLMYFYYDMHVTLLEKSMALIVPGVVILLIYLFIRKKLEFHEEV